MTRLEVCLAYFALVFDHYHLQIEAFVPVGVQSLLYDACGVGLLSIDGRHCEGVWESYTLGISNKDDNEGNWMGLNVLKTSRLYSPSAAITGSWSVSV